MIKKIYRTRKKQRIRGLHNKRKEQHVVEQMLKNSRLNWKPAIEPKTT